MKFARVQGRRGEKRDKGKGESVDILQTDGLNSSVSITSKRFLTDKLQQIRTQALQEDNI